jgi:6-phosphogluconolactonase
MDSAHGNRGSRVIRVYDDIESLSRAAAEFFVEEAIKVSRKRGRFSVLLAGGGTPQRTYQLLAQAPFSAAVPWNQLHIFWGDERCVPLDDPRNNAFIARKMLIDHVSISEDQIHPIRTDMIPSDAAADYAMQLRRFFHNEKPVFDLVILGLGEDGHTASLFPGTLEYPEDRWVVVTRKAGEDIKRISLTPSVINMASKVLFLVSGTNKASVVAAVLTGPTDPLRLPAQLIMLPDDRLLWFIDSAASGS